ncbi:hypothetical protein HR45_03910 [Shewanella mangrovi]|uniref:Uncharacterized protein n=1 Tax=Shewanella mangrovi TaxID=1515746 RepID=A0A094LTP4_9GAMM|nr:hypothetical protein [Shewanella mangrovi]KFZ38578.1 hypothetical protein HR45_03910 [Shewanella mangrovi]
MAIPTVSINNTPQLSQAVASNRPLRTQEKVIQAEAVSQTSSTDINIDADVLNAKYQARLEYDSDTNAHSQAISQYLLTQHADQREAISSMVGVDVYA